MQGKTDYILKNFCIRAYEMSSYWFVLFWHADAHENTIILALQRL